MSRRRRRPRLAGSSRRSRRLWKSPTTTPSTSTVSPTLGERSPAPCTDPIVTIGGSQSASTGGSTGPRWRSRRPGVFSASPTTSVPVLPGMPARSKSLRTQSAVVSVSVPSGMREAPPGGRRCRRSRCRASRRRTCRSPAPPSLMAIESTSGDTRPAGRATPSSFASRSLPSAPVKPVTSSSETVPFSRRVRAPAYVSARPSASGAPNEMTSSTHAEAVVAGVALDLEHAVGAQVGAGLDEQLDVLDVGAGGARPRTR